MDFSRDFPRLSLKPKCFKPLNMKTMFEFLIRYFLRIFSAEASLNNLQVFPNTSWNLYSHFETRNSPHWHSETCERSNIKCQKRYSLEKNTKPTLPPSHRFEAPFSYVRNKLNSNKKPINYTNEKLFRPLEESAPKLWSRTPTNCLIFHEIDTGIT